MVVCVGDESKFLVVVYTTIVVVVLLKLRLSLSWAKMSMHIVPLQLHWKYSPFYSADL